MLTVQEQEAQEAEALSESMENAFTDGTVCRFLKIAGVDTLLNDIEERGRINNKDMTMVMVLSFALGVTLGKRVSDLDHIIGKEVG